ncbi:MAG: S8 family serine peptidase [Chloroflexota bacterium]|jgi:serine protease AprX
MNKSANRFFLVSTYLLLFISARAYGANNVPVKIDPRLAADLSLKSEVEFLVVLNEQADLSAASAIVDKDERGRFVYQTLTTVAEQSQAPLLALLNARGIEYKPYWVSNLIRVHGDGDLARLLAQREDVARLHSNSWQQIQLPTPDSLNKDGRRNEAIEWNIALIGAPEVWASGITGQGAVIGGQDTGYDWTHPALVNKYRGWDGQSADHNFNWHDAIHENNPATLPGNPCGFDSPVPCDDGHHGTHTMGTMVGDEGEANQIGVAPGASWIGCRNMEEGWGTPATYTECYEWFIAPYPFGGNSFTDGDPTQAPHIVNNSWSCPPSEGCIAADVLRQVVENVRAAGILTVHSAGNNGGSGCGSINQPAAIYDASFTVGATDMLNQIAFFSSLGPVTVDGINHLKPDIVAPGVNVRSSIPGNGYISLSGTSMSAPHVAGLAALLVSANPAVAGNVDLLEQAITQTALPLVSNRGCSGDSNTAVPNHVFGWGRIDAQTALQYVVPVENLYKWEWYLPVQTNLE